MPNDLKNYLTIESIVEPGYDRTNNQDGNAAVVQSERKTKENERKTGILIPTVFICQYLNGQFETSYRMQFVYWNIR